MEEITLPLINFARIVLYITPVLDINNSSSADEQRQFLTLYEELMELVDSHSEYFLSNHYAEILCNISRVRHLISEDNF